MTLSLIEIFSIIVIHWIADFILQTDKQAKGKSKNWNDLLGHTATYSACWFLIGVLLKIIIPSFDYNVGLFTAITLTCHTITDYFTSRLNSKLWAKGDVHNFFVSVGADQCLHYFQLFLTYYFLKKM